MTPDPDARYWPTPAAYQEQPMIETQATPPDTDHDHGEGDGDGVTRVAIHVIDVHDEGYDVGMNLCGARATDPDAWAEALLRVAHGIATVLGPDHVWALNSRLAAYDGTRR